MAGSTPKELCDHLKRIVARLEQGDLGQAATLASGLDPILAELPQTMSDAELQEAQQLLARYRDLGATMSEQLTADMRRVGAAQRLRAYLRR